MGRDEIIDHLCKCISAVLDRELPGISGDTRILEDLDMDSMKFIELLMTLEDTLGLSADADDFTPEVFQTIGSFADFIEARI